MKSFSCLYLFELREGVFHATTEANFVLVSKESEKSSKKSHMVKDSGYLRLSCWP